MKLRTFVFIKCMILVLLCGCSSKQTIQGDPMPEETETGDSLVLTQEDLQWKDNSRDAYSAVCSYQMEFEDSEEERYGFSFGTAFGAFGVRCFRILAGYELEDIYQWVGVSREGEHIQRDEYHTSAAAGLQKVQAGENIWGISSIWGMNQCGIISGERKEEGNYVYYLSIWEEDGKVSSVRRITPPDPSSFMNFQNVMVDKQGNLHFMGFIIFDDEESPGQYSLQYVYFVEDQEGNLLTVEELSGEGIAGRKYLCADLCPFYDGRVGLCCEYQMDGEENEKAKQGMDLLYYDAEGGEMKLLSSAPEAPMDCILWKEDTVLYADAKGIHLCDLEWQNHRSLYLWKNHSITITGIDIFPDYEKEGSLQVLLQNDKKRNYRRLEPTCEEVSLQEIDFAVRPHQIQNYKGFVDYFNRKYPNIKVNLTVEYGETQIQTELMAGRGPVLMDTLLTGFEGKEAYWEPLDEFLEVSGLREEIYAPILQEGQIGGVTYGIVPHFCIHTLVTAEEGISKEDLTYQGFVEYVKAQNCKTIFFSDGNPLWVTLFFNFFTNGGEESYWIRREEGGQVGEKRLTMDPEHMGEILDLMEDYCKVTRYDLSTDRLGTGEVLFRPVFVADYSDLYYREKEEGQNVRYLGYPSRDGAKHYISYYYPITIRKTATEQEKKAALLFLHEYLSYEGQLAADEASINFKLPVRRDALEEVLRRSKKQILRDAYYEVPKEQMEELRTRLAQLEDTFFELIDTAVPKKYMPSDLSEIFWEELEGYMEGDQPKDLTLDHLGSRLGLYFQE